MRRPIRLLIVALTVFAVSGIGPLALERVCVEACHGGSAAAPFVADPCCGDEAPAADQCDCCTHLGTTVAQPGVATPPPPTRTSRHATDPPDVAPSAPAADILHVPLATLPA